jgi:hypothetical protein
MGFGMGHGGGGAAATEGLLRIWRGLGISRRSFDVAIVLILLGIGCWALLSNLLWGTHLGVSKYFAVSAGVVALSVWLRWNE